MNNSLLEMIESGGLFQGYAYAYPHKTAYGPIDPPEPLSHAWSGEDKSALFLYAHLPFCEMRCGFCNLLTTSNPETGLVARYLDALDRQAKVVSAALGGNARFARLAIGGGTPTYLSIAELSALFATLGRFNGLTDSIPKAVEASPSTIDAEKASFLWSQGVTRLSLGVQSFFEGETRMLGRAQRRQDVRTALTVLKNAEFPCLNIDLIYGIQSQTEETWLDSIREALDFAPQEIYLYPLYVRPLTGLGRQGRKPADRRIQFYRLGRAFLLERGFQQISMRLFRSSNYCPTEGPVYCCQEDGMVGLGAGARSYTSGLHYSTEFAVAHSAVRSIIDDFASQTTDRYSLAHHGCRLGADEQRRRYVIKSLLRSEGLNLDAYRAQFESAAFDDLPQLAELESGEFAAIAAGALRLTERGFEISDVLGTWLASDAIRERMIAAPAI